MFIDDFAKQLSRELQLNPPLVPDERGLFSLRVGSKLHVTLSPHEAGLAIAADVGRPLPENSERREELFRWLLLANLLGQGTGRGMLGLDSKGERVQLVLALPYEIPYLECRQYFEEFLNFAEYWLGEIEEFERRASPQS